MNSPEWFTSAVGAIFAGGCSSGVYTTNNSHSILYQLKHRQITVLTKALRFIIFQLKIISSLFRVILNSILNVKYTFLYVKWLNKMAVLKRTKNCQYK